MNSDKESQHASANQGGLFAGLAAITRNFAGLMLNRLELFALELSDARTNLLRLLLMSSLGLIATCFAIAYWSVLVVYLTWDSLGWKILLFFSLLFTVAAIVLWRFACAVVAQGKLSLPATMQELRNDRDALL